MNRGVLAALAAGLLVACSSPSEVSSDTSSLCASGAKSSATPAGSPPVSFRNEVLPIFAASCAFGSCHGSPSSEANNGVFLGARSGPTDASAIRAALLGGTSVEVPSLPHVAPSDPSRSYLLRKLDGDFCGIPECANGECGQRMPRGGDPLDAKARATIEAWIASGAPDS